MDEVDKVVHLSLHPKVPKMAQYHIKIGTVRTIVL